MKLIPKYTRLMLKNECHISAFFDQSTKTYP